MNSSSSDKLTKFPKDIYEGLVIPKIKRPLTVTAEKVVVKAAMTNDEIKAKEGTYFDGDNYEIFDRDVDVYIELPDGKEKLVAKLRKSVIDPEMIKTGWEGFWITAGPSRNRGAAAGPIAVDSNYWKKKKPVNIRGWSANYKLPGKEQSLMRVNNNVFSSVLGYFNATPFMKLPCRLTSYTQRYWKYYKHGLPYIKEIDHCFEKLVNKEYKLQLAAALQKPLLRIEDTAFSSITINRNFRTALHVDDGDFKGGFGNLSVLERGSYHGGYTLLPQFKIGFNVRAGDFLAMDVHQWHCNTELYETAEDKKKNKGLERIHKDNLETGTLGSEKIFSRVSFVCYLREKLRECDLNKTRKYFDEIGFNSRTNSFRSTMKKRKTPQTDE
jgi:hypothetical protein